MISRPLAQVLTGSADRTDSAPRGAPVSSNRNRLLYCVLAVLIVGTVAFQLAISWRSIETIWLQTGVITPDTITSWDIELIAHILTPFACLALGFYVAWIRIGDRRGWLLLAVLISFSLEADGANRNDEVLLWLTPLKHVALAYRSFSLFTFPFWLMLFAFYFPEPADWDRRHPAVKWILLAPVALFTCGTALLRVGANETHSIRWEAGRESFGRYWIEIFYISVVLFLLILAAKIFSSKSPDSRRRLRVLLFGIALTLVPLSTLDAIARILHRPEDKLPAWLLVPIIPALLFFPITIAYVTVVERALDVGVVVRQSLQYVLARRGVIFLQILISVVVVIVIADLAGRLSFFQRILITAVGIGAVLLVGVGGNRLGAWIDRQFFREAYQSEQIINALAESVSSMVELTPLLSTVARRIAEALHIREVAVFLSDGNLYRPAFALGYPEPPNRALENGMYTIQELRAKKEPVRVYGEDVRLRGEGGSEEAQLLHELNAQLVVSLLRRDDLLGFLSLGSKYSEAPYSRTDMNLLQSLAAQTALAVENSRLTAAVASETAERVVIQRELAIAREVQERLFPQSYPDIPGLEYDATCRPAREVGGDYYDFLELLEGKLGVAIGDVSGKGIPASLLMASLQASLRGQAAGAASVSIERMLDNINRLIYAATPANRYATFFYAQYDPVLHHLHYVNAGHNAPMLLRKQSGSPACIRLETGGPPVGLLPEVRYQSGGVEMSPGDLLLLFTDGVSEAMNSADEEWGESGLLASLTDFSNQAAPELIRTLLCAADAFVAGAPQHDDMTLVVFRVLA